MNNVFAGVLFLIICFLASCRLLCKDDLPSVARKDYKGGELRTDGYYYGLRTVNYKGISSYTLLIFYRNGVVQQTGSSDPAGMMNEMVSNNPAKDNHYGWGAFGIIGDQMELSMYQPSHSCARCSTSYYTIINDTTIQQQGMQPHPEYGPFDDTLHFVAFPKPDSANRFY